MEYGPAEIKERLISKKVFSDEEIDRVLKNLKLKTSNLKTDKIQKVKVGKARELAKMIGRRFPDILMVGITGSVAAGYPKKSADIDLMIVTKKDRLWLTRLLLRIFVLVRRIPHRKYGVKETSDEFCFNLWLEEDVLKLPKSRQNLRNAMDSILMMPIYNRKNTYENFMKDNKWIKKYLANTYVKNN